MPLFIVKKDCTVPGLCCLFCLPLILWMFIVVKFLWKTKYWNRIKVEREDIYCRLVKKKKKDSAEQKFSFPLLFYRNVFMGFHTKICFYSLDLFLRRMIDLLNDWSTDSGGRTTAGLQTPGSRTWVCVQWVFNFKSILSQFQKITTLCLRLQISADVFCIK